jgi:hypothetical protein
MTVACGLISNLNRQLSVAGYKVQFQRPPRHCAAAPASMDISMYVIRPEDVGWIISNIDCAVMKGVLSAAKSHS